MSEVNETPEIESVWTPNGLYQGCPVDWWTFERRNDGKYIVRALNANHSVVQDFRPMTYKQALAYRRRLTD
jgi:hypothetical protein